MAEPWMKWTILEACTKTASKIFQKVIGRVAVSFNQTLFATFVVGLVQVIGGFIMAETKGRKILTDPVSILGSCLFGFNATVCTVVPFYIFVLDGDMGINTFIITLSIIPGALIDRIFFNYKLSGREWFGIFVAIFAGYSILGWPSPHEFLQMPLWIWLSFIVMLLVAINQGITQKIKKIDPFVKNFWGGLTTFILTFIALLSVGSLDLVVDFSPAMQKLWGASAAVGFIVICMWSYNLMSYKGGAHIAIKKLVMNGSYLIMAMIFGILIFSESLTFAKVIGVMFYLIAFSLMDKGTWEYICQFFSNDQVKKVNSF